MKPRPLVGELQQSLQSFFSAGPITLVGIVFFPLCRQVSVSGCSGVGQVFKFMGPEEEVADGLI